MFECLTTRDEYAKLPWSLSTDVSLLTPLQFTSKVENFEVIRSQNSTGFSCANIELTSRVKQLDQRETDENLS